MLVILLLHIFINLNAIGVSLYLAFTLSKNFSSNAEIDEGDEIDGTKYNLTLISIMISALITSFVGVVFYDVSL